MNRRDFLTITAAGIAGLALPVPAKTAGRVTTSCPILCASEDHVRKNYRVGEMIELVGNRGEFPNGTYRITHVTSNSFTFDLSAPTK